MQTVYRADGTALCLEKELGRGGEGTVFGVRGSPAQVAKVYHPDLRRNRRQKVSAMVAARSSHLASFVAWPSEALFAAQGSAHFCGFMMPRVSAAYVPIHMLYGPASRQKQFPKRDYRFLVRAAENLSSAVADIHAAGHVVGDLNHSNVLVGPDATVRFIDADSFEVRRKGQRFACTVGVPEFTPPELQGRDLSLSERTANHDRFGLAVLVFQLLFMGRHPFAGRFACGEVALPDAIRRGLFAFSATMASEVVAPPHSLALRDVGESVSPLFDRAFLTPVSVERGRPDASAWVRALQVLQSRLKRCDANPQHHYPSSSTSCIWCSFRARGVDFFPGSDSAPRPTSGPGEGLPDDADIRRLWYAVTTVKADPGFDAALLQRSYVTSPPPELESEYGWSLEPGGGCAGLLFVCMVGAMFGARAAALVAVAFVAMAVLGPVLEAHSVRRQSRRPERMAKVEDHERRESLAVRLLAIQADLRGIKQEHKIAWAQEMKRLELAHKRLLSSDADQKSELLMAKVLLATKKRDAYLRTRVLRADCVDGVGEGLLSTLASFGFRNALDVLQAAPSGFRRFSTFQPRCAHCGGAMRQQRVRLGSHGSRVYWSCTVGSGCSGLHPGLGTGSAGRRRLLCIPGIGSVKEDALLRWASRLAEEYDSGLTARELARQSSMVQSRHREAVLKDIAVLEAGPNRLAAINNRCANKVAPLVAAFSSLEMHW